MVEQIAELVKKYGQQSVIDNPDVPNTLNNQIMEAATTTITGGLQNMLSGGGLESLISMFTGQQRNTGIRGNPIVNMMVGHLANKLAGSLNLNPALANAIANNIIPSVVNSLINNTRSNDPSNDSYDLNDLIASLTGGNGAADNRSSNGGMDFQEILNQITNSGGQMPSLDNIIDTVSQEAQYNQQEKSNAGGLGDLIKGFFK